MKIAREGWPLIAVFALVSAGAGALGVRWLGPSGWAIVAVGLVLTGWCVWFFRDPDRSTPSDPLAVISPADGVVCSIGPAGLPVELGVEPSGRDALPMQRVCVFMNVFNVHVNRAPVAGTIEKLAYVHGRFFNASFDKASIHNERQAVLLCTADGRRIAFVQIAGLVARRIVCRLTERQAVRAGERFGLIRFGSRVDVYVPGDSTVSAVLGQKVVAGETVLAHLAPESSESAVVPTPPPGQGAAPGR